MPAIAYFECSRCHAQLSAAVPQTVCTACLDQPAGALYVRYDLSNLQGLASRDALEKDAASTWAGMWRYRSVLPDAKPVTLGEGWTPMLLSKRFPCAFLKEEGANPTGTFKARGLALAVTMARHYGLPNWRFLPPVMQRVRLRHTQPRPGSKRTSSCQSDVPFANYVEAVAYGANVTLVDGLISDCARIVKERSQTKGWFDVSTLKEPFRVEGKKTMGYELVEQLGWEYPDAVFYPTGGGVGMIGMWKAFEEMEQLGWVKPGQATEDDCCAGRRLCSRNQGIRDRKNFQPDVAKGGHLRRGIARPKALWRLYPARSPRIGRGFARSHRQRNPRFDSGLGA